MATKRGTSKKDKLKGTNAPDKLIGLAGDDILDGRGGKDKLVGGPGNDTLKGGKGDDVLKGGPGLDTARYAAAIDADDVTFSGGKWTVTAGAEGRDTLDGMEIIQGSAGRILLVGGGGFATVQAAADAARDGDTILIGAGTYSEQVVLDGLDDVTLIGKGAVTIQAPADLVETARSSNDRELHAVVTVIDGTNVQLRNVDIDGDGRGNTIDEGGGAGSAQFNGVLYRNASGALTDVDVTGVRSPYGTGTTADGFPVLKGGFGGVAVRVDNDAERAFSMSGGTVDDFHSVGLVLINVDVDVSGVTITGTGTQAVRQTGIQLSGATGAIDGNTVTNIGFLGSSPALGIDVTAASVLDITGNVITGTNAAVPTAFFHGISFHDTDGPNTGGTVSGNTITAVDRGLVVQGDVTPDEIHFAANTFAGLDNTDQLTFAIYYTPDPALATVHTPVGSALADVLTGGSGVDSIDGGLGGDNLTGGAGADFIDAGSFGDGRDFIFYVSVDDFGDTIVAFDGGNIGDWLLLRGTLATMLDDIDTNAFLDQRFSSGTSATGIAADLDTTYEGLVMTGGVHDGIATASLTDAAAVAAAFNTEFAITASVGQDAVLIIHEFAMTRFSAWQYVEGGGAEIQAGELTLIALVSTDQVAFDPVAFF